MTFNQNELYIRRCHMAGSSLTHDLLSSFALAGDPVHLADSQSARFLLGAEDLRRFSIRYSKVLLIWASHFASLVVFNNLTDYESNYTFVSHVLKMDMAFPANRSVWRAIHTPFLYNVLYSIIILAEAAVAALCWLGGFRLLRSIDDVDRFNKGKGIAIAGLTLGLVLWFTGYITIGGDGS